VRFLLDENLSPVLAELLAAAGHDTFHVRDLGLLTAADLTGRRGLRCPLSLAAPGYDEVPMSRNP
jgi:hypothetical protein